MPTKRVPLFTLRLETNGTYRAESGWTQPTQDGDLVVLRPEIVRGTWAWDTKQQEFNLTPKNGGFRFEIRRLRLDRDDPTTLQWIPASSLTHGGGAIDYLRLKRQ